MPIVKKKVKRKDNALICLTHEQVKTNITNVATIMKLPKPELKFQGELKISKDDIARYNLSGIDASAECYELWECKDQFYFIVVYAHSVEIKYFVACEWFNHLFKNFVYDVDRPKVYLCSAFTIDKTKYSKITTGLLKCPYRFVIIPKIHPLTGSINGLNGFISQDELLETKDRAFNNRDYSEILASDPAVKIVNALPGELIRVKYIASDAGNVFSAYKIRRVTSTRTRLGYFDGSGLDMLDTKTIIDVEDEPIAEE